eukprot:12819926-Heterocapsa_arctica.AAC.1
MFTNLHHVEFLELTPPARSSSGGTWIRRPHCSTRRLWAISPYVQQLTCSSPSWSASGSPSRIT